MKWTNERWRDRPCYPSVTFWPGVLLFIYTFHISLYHQSTSPARKTIELVWHVPVFLTHTGTQRSQSLRDVRCYTDPYGITSEIATRLLSVFGNDMAFKKLEQYVSFSRITGTLVLYIVLKITSPSLALSLWICSASTKMFPLRPGHWSSRRAALM